MSATIPLQQRRQLGSLLRSVVKVMCVSDSPDYDQPWQSHGPVSHSGSGAIIDTKLGLRVLTNAHCVSNHMFVEVRRYGKAHKYEAEVVAMGHECDLALLHIDDETFFEGTTPIEVGDLPRLGQRVSVCGYPIGGERMSISQGIVSRIELVNYAQSNRSLLAVQVDAAINSGNSGGPVIKNSMLAGVAFQSLDDAEGVGYMIAPPVVRHFLTDVESGQYKGFPALGARTQPLESKAHRRHLRLPESRTGGVMVRRVAVGGSAYGVLEEGDVLLAVDGVPINDDGTVDIYDGVQFRYCISQRYIGERIPLTVWRRGQEVTCVLEMKPPPYLVSEDRYDVKPSYFVYGGLLFVPLTRNFLSTWGESWWQTAPRELVWLYERGVRTEERQEVVVLQKVLADRVNQGYHDLENIVIDRVNGMPVRSLKHLTELVDHPAPERQLHLVDAKDPQSFVSFHGTDGRSIVLDHDLVARRGRAILRKFGVPLDRSADLRDGEPESA